jgi:hypothetical protein
VIDAFLSFPVALVHRVHAQESGLAARIGLAALANRNAYGLGGRVVCRLPAIGRAGSEIVQVRDRQAGQALKLLASEGLKLALQNASRSRPAESLVQRSTSASKATSDGVYLVGNRRRRTGLPLIVPCWRFCRIKRVICGTLKPLILPSSARTQPFSPRLRRAYCWATNVF